MSAVTHSLDSITALRILKATRCSGVINCAKPESLRGVESPSIIFVTISSKSKRASVQMIEFSFIFLSRKNNMRFKFSECIVGLILNSRHLKAVPRSSSKWRRTDFMKVTTIPSCQRSPMHLKLFCSVSTHDSLMRLVVQPLLWEHADANAQSGCSWDGDGGNITFFAVSTMTAKTLVRSHPVLLPVMKPPPVSPQKHFDWRGKVYECSNDVMGNHLIAWTLLCT